MKEDIIIKEQTTYATTEIFDYLINQGIINPAEIISAKINYNKEKGLPSWEAPIEEYPIILKTCYGQKVFIYCVTAGYGGSGPNATYEILKKLDFDVSKSEIFTNNITGRWYLNKK